jgi:hypothetical protein
LTTSLKNQICFTYTTLSLIGPVNISIKAQTIHNGPKNISIKIATIGALLKVLIAPLIQRITKTTKIKTANSKSDRYASL